MRRLFIILMLTLLPLQASWAAVCAYCPDNCISELAPGAKAEAPADDASELGASDECSRCQMGGAGIASSLADSRIAPHLNTFAFGGGGVFPDSGQPDRPERPNWMRAA